MGVGNQIWLCLRLVLGSLTLLSYQKKTKEINNPTSSSDSSPSESSPCSSFSSEEKKYDVFLSFRGEDTRRGFIGYLYDALCKKGIHTYMDEQTLKSGHEISSTLMKAIEESKIYIIVLSQNFASSTWCLNELVQILKCKRNENVIPIFYGIDPSIVRKQKDSYAEAFDNHERRFRDNKMEKVKQWRVALEEVADMSGYDSKNFRSECELVQTIVTNMLSKLHKYQLTNCGHLFGIEEAVKRIESLLSIGSTGVRVIGIWGMGGIGKTTLSNIVFLKFAYHFDACCFIKDNQEAGDGTDDLRYKIFCDLFKGENLRHTDTLAIGSRFILDRLSWKKVFIVIDDLNGRPSKLKDLFEGYQFGNESRIIVTSRDKQLLKAKATSIYELKGLDHRDALQLFCFHAFGPNSLATGYEALIERIAFYANGNPLALKVLGSSLKSKSIKEWDSALDKLKTYSDPDIQKVLRISFDGLGDKGIQGIFLDIACFNLYRLPREYAEDILNRTEHSNAVIGISALIDKSLLEEWEDDFVGGVVLRMPDLLRQMGQGIVFDKNKDLGNRSRLWNVKGVCCVLEKNTGTSKIEGISLTLEDLKKDVKVSPTAFAKMCNLRILKISCNLPFLKISPAHAILYDHICIGRPLAYVLKRVHLTNGLESFVSNEIRYFQWDLYPLKYLPYLSTENLVVLIMRHSQLELLWNKDQPLELEKLKKIDLSFSKHLIQIPNLSRAINLQDIWLQHCTSLVHIPPFFQNLNKLRSLNMKDCKNLEDGIENLPNSLRYLRMDGTATKSLPESIWELKYLEELHLSSCTNLRKISEISNHMECLVQIVLNEAEIEEKPESIENPTAVRGLYLDGYHKIKFLPNSLCKLLHLRLLTLGGCSSLEELPPLPHGLESLDIRKCERLKSIADFPSSVYQLNADDCRSLETISSRGSPSKPPFVHRFYYYSFKNCLKLDEDTRNNVIVDRARLLSSPPPDDEHLFGYFLYPGYEIPEWFSYQNDGGNSINNIHLPENWFELRLRFAFCVVFYESCNEKDFPRWNFQYEFNFKTNTSNNDDCLYSYYSNFFEWNIYNAIDSDHVHIFPTVRFIHDLSKVFGPSWSSICSNITEASFRVTSKNWPIIKRCGFQFCNAYKGLEELNVDRFNSNQPNGRKHNGDLLPHNNSKRIKLMG